MQTDNPEIGAGFAWREFLPSGTDTDLVAISLSPAKAVLHRSEPCQIGAGFVGRQSSLNGPPQILKVPDPGRFCWSGVSAGWD